MALRATCILLALPIVASLSQWALAQPPEPELARLKAHVTTLASREFAGRRGEGGEKAAAYIINAFRDLGLEPLFNGEYGQPIPDTVSGKFRGRNVGAVLRGADRALRDDWIIVAAHFDHLGVRGGVLYPGADDNASGVAMMLEVARSLTRSEAPPRRSVMFIGFDLEEVGLFGSRYFVEHSPIPLGRVALFINADMLGRSLGGVCHGRVFVMGSEHAPGLRRWISRAAADRPISVGILGSDLLIINRSDYGPFRSRRVPYLFFSTGENPAYHSPSDTAETLDYAKLEVNSRIIYGVARRAAMADSVPKWNPQPDHPLEEAVTIRDVMRCLMKNRETLKIGGVQVLLMTNALRSLDEIIARGAITPEERSAILQAARIVLATVF